jgi:hypothetical protein
MPKRQKLFVEVVIPRSRASNHLRAQAPIIETRDPDFEDGDDDYVPSDPEIDQTKSLRASTRTSYYHHHLDDQTESLTGGRVRSSRQPQDSTPSVYTETAGSRVWLLSAGSRAYRLIV